MWVQYSAKKIDYHDKDDRDFVMPTAANKVKLENGAAAARRVVMRKKKSKKRYCKTCDISFKTYRDLVFHRYELTQT